MIGMHIAGSNETFSANRDRATTIRSFARGHYFRKGSLRMLRLPFLFLLLLTLPALGAHSADIGTQPDSTAAVYRIQGLGGGLVTDGSAVLIAPGRLLTACHVTRRAKSIRVGREVLQWPAYPAYTDTEHDLCILAVPALSAAKPAAIRPTENLQLGDAVVAAGYPRGAKLGVSQGQIKGLHEHNGARVLQVSAPFDYGQSGGALFDTAGRLIGIIGFKVIAGGNFHFVLPLAWAGDQIPGQAASGFAGPSEDPAFWQRADKALPKFLFAASLEADRNWNALEGVAQDWVAADQANPAAWHCLGRALVKLKRGPAAAEAFARAAELRYPEPAPEPSYNTIRVAYFSEHDPASDASIRWTRQ